MLHNTAFNTRARQEELFDKSEMAPETPSAIKKARSGAFTDNMKLPVHRWFRYSAGFSAEWAQRIILEKAGSGCAVLDPFAGSGTTLLAAQQAGARSVGLEAHPFIARVASAKLAWSSDPDEFFELANRLLLAAKRLRVTKADESCALLLARCYTTDALDQLYALKIAYTNLSINNDKKMLLWLLVTSILRECSHVGTAQWQYILPNKSKSRSIEPFIAFESRIHEFHQDMCAAKRTFKGSASIIEADARVFFEPRFMNHFDLVVTSPHYPNNYDYADATRLEMSFWGEVNSWGDLHDAVRHKLVCSCSQHSAKEKMNLDELLSNNLLLPIRVELETVCRELETVRETKGGKKTYHTMIAAYFLGLAEVWQSLRPLMKTDSSLLFVIGDSAPYGVYAPCDLWLGELALAAGFKSFKFEKLRDRNTKWKNRKHTVPLKEGILTVTG